MTIDHSTNQLSQAFRVRSPPGSTSSETISIPTHQDSRTGRQVVRWKDILQYFESAKGVMNGEDAILFLTDEDLEDLVPLRIAHHPGVILDVVIGNSEQGESGRDVLNMTTAGAAIDVDKACIQFPEGCTTTDISLLTRDVAMLDTSGDQSIVMYSRDMSKEARLSLLSYNQLYSSCFQAIMSGQATQAADIKQSMDQHFDRLQVEMDKNKALQEQLVQMQQQMEIKQQQMQLLQEHTRGQLLEKQQQMQELQQKMNEKQDHILQMQQRTLDRLAVIQTRIQALAIQTYELHEYPIPRLFIVLPKTMRLRDKLAKPFAEQFRLYFLCECGAHTMSEDSKILHEIHLAKHEGYDLDKPTEFFEKYGSYVLTLMYMIKYGIVAAGLIVPPLANTKILDGLDMAKESLKCLEKDIGPLVDDTIRFLQDIKTNTTIDSELATEHTESDKLEVLEGADLRQLESYLKVKDEGRVLGNLYRIVTPEGHVKWVCFDHYRSNYRKSAIQQLRDVVEANHGKFIEETGRIEIKIVSSTLAKQFYDAMVKARGIQELEVTLGWDAIMDDLRAFADSITKANVIRLTMDGSYFKGPALDVVNRNRRFDPLLQVASNGRIQSFRLRSFDKFFSRVNDDSLATAPKLRVLSIEPEIPFTEKTAKSYFSGFLERCPSLKTLELKLHHQYSISKATAFILNKLHQLESLVIDCGRLSVTASVLKGKVEDMTMTIVRLCDLNSDDLKLVEQGPTQLAIEYTPQTVDEDRLVMILHQNSGLSRLQIGCLEERSLTIINLVISTRATILKEQGFSCLRTFELMDEKLTPFRTGPFNDKTHIQSRLSFTKDSADFDMRTWIRLQDATSITNEHVVWDFIHQYGWSVVCLMAPWTFNNDLIAVLDDVTKKRGSQLEGQVAAAGLLLKRYEKTLYYLGLYGNSIEHWLPKVALSSTIGRNFPKLETFGLVADFKSGVPPACVPWIAMMVSAPTLGRELDSPSQLSSQGSDTQQQPHDKTGALGPWMSLKHIALQRVLFQPEDWRTVIEAMDFSMLEHLDFKGTNFSQEQLKTLIDRIPGNISDIPLKILDIADTDLARSTNPRILLRELQRKAPFIKIKGFLA
ncbi:hypothetical protein BGZ65_004788 [Modicella reniformis]|uniref:Uncharacterized protein n=1 Tax=Modicella reniformis TaxID=1440133 RepID=A0A9P6IKQ4_9FUNG|nr:hypothetical protein BGZ65_004788 [Modicella reniformis]